MNKKLEFLKELSELLHKHKASIEVELIDDGELPSICIEISGEASIDFNTRYLSASDVDHEIFILEDVDVADTLREMDCNYADHYDKALIESLKDRELITLEYSGGTSDYYAGTCYYVINLTDKGDKLLELNPSRY